MYARTHTHSLAKEAFARTVLTTVSFYIPLRPLSMFALMRQVYSREGGITAFYKGLTMNYIKGPIAVSVSFVVNDTLKLYLRHRPEPSLD
jgi:Na+/serine symporter